MAADPNARHELVEALRQGLRRTSKTLRVAGWLLIVLGAIAIIAPEVATLLVTGFIAWLLVFNAVAHFYLAFQVHGTWRIAGAVLVGIVSAVAGVMLLSNPLAGAETLTFLLAAYFVATGVVKAVAAFQLRHVRGWVWTFVSALASIFLGFIVFSGWPGTATWAVGLLVGGVLIVNSLTGGAIKETVAPTPKPEAPKPAASGTG